LNRNGVSDVVKCPVLGVIEGLPTMETML